MKITADGLIDEVRVYNRALGAGEITTLYNSGAAKLKVPTNLGLVGYWPMNEGTSTLAGDFSGKGNNGTLTNMAFPATATSGWATAGKLGGALNFDGGDDSVNLGSSASLQITGDITVGAWVKVTAATFPDTTTNWNIVQLTESYQSYGWLIRVDGTSNKIYYRTSQAGTHTGMYGNTALSKNTWYYVAVTKSGTTGRIYLNGVLDGSGTINTPVVSSPLYISFNPQAMNGLIDEVRVYNRVLSATEIQTLYQADYAKVNAPQNDRLTNGLVGMWSFNGADMTNATATDVSGNGNNGTLTNGPTKAIGKIGQALNFDGGDEYVDIPDGILNATLDYTIAAWGKVNDFSVDSGAQRRLVMLKDGSGNGISLGTFATGNNFLFRKTGGTSISKITANGYSTGVWYHVVVTKTSDTTITLYVNGVADTATVVDAGFTAASFIGTHNTTVGSFNGLIDEVRVYNRALSASEVLQLYNLGK